MTHLKSDKQISTMKEGGKRLRYVLEQTLEQVVPGKTAYEIDQFADRLIQKQGGYPSFKRVNGYKWATCICVNDCIVHGVPKKQEIIKENDVVTVDVGMMYKELNTDTSWTIRVESSNVNSQMSNVEEIDHFLEVGKRALEAGIKQAVVGNRVGHISKAIQDIVEKQNGYSVVRSLIGHGVGRELHEEPEVPGYLVGKIDKTPLLKEGMTIAIEVIYNMGSKDVVLDKDGWTIRTKDVKISGLFERSIAITKEGSLMLTS